MKKNLFRLGFGIVLVAMLASCSKLGNLTKDDVIVNPNPLEVKAGKVAGTITCTFPEKYFAKKAVVSITPVLKYEGGEAVGETVTYQGQKVKGNNQTIQYKAGGTATQKFSFDYVPAMDKSVLVLRFNATVGNKEVQIPDLEIAVGCISTSTLADAATIMPAYAQDTYELYTLEAPAEADFMFDLAKTNIKTNSSVDALQKSAKSIKADNKRSIESISIVAAASPEGGLELNEKLAQGRKDNTSSYIKGFTDQAAIDAQYIAEDWDGFQKLVQESTVQDKELILRVLGSYSDPETREKEIRNLSAAYKELETDILPKLRRAHVAMTVKVQNRTDEEIFALAESNPTELNATELAHAAKAACQAGNKEASAKYTQLNAAQYPTDWRTGNNLGALNFSKGDYEASKAALATSMSNGGADQAETNYNLALIALKNNDTEAAAQYLAKASGAENYAEAKGLLYIQKGEYQKAVEAFGNKISNNSALAQLLVNNVDKAQSILNSVEKKDAKTYYLLAICAARLSNDANVYSNLKKAVAIDNSYAAKSKSDYEFAKYWSAAEFAAIK